MNGIQLNNVHFEYGSHSPESLPVKAVNGITDSVSEGEFIVILGRNGSGKSTLARLMNALLQPSSGEVTVFGHSTQKDEAIWEVRKTLGMVFQNPDNQMVATTVEEDVAFGPENLGVDPKEIRQRVDASLAYVGMDKYIKHAPHMLSGGQKQRIAIAGVLAMHPRCIVLDESTSMLDPNGRREVLEVLHSLNKEKKMTIILITHHMDEAVHADRILVMDKGQVIGSGSPVDVFNKLDMLKEAGLDVPPVTRLMQLLMKDGFITGPLPITQEGAIEKLKAIFHSNSNIQAGMGSKHDALPSEEDLNNYRPAGSIQEESQPLVSIRNLTHVYMPDTLYEKKALDNVNLEIHKGEILGIIGHTGSGKSTLVQHMNGILKPTSGEVVVDGFKAEGKKLKELRRKVGLIFQYPEHQLFAESVHKDIAFGLEKLNLNENEQDRRIHHAIELLGLSPDLLDKSPFELSGGQKRRVAIAGVLVMEPSVLVLDEPTAGLDPKGSAEVYKLLLDLNQKRGTTIVIISHNMDDIAAFCNRVAVMNEGKLVMLDSPGVVFNRVEELKKLNLDVPQMTALFKELQKSDFVFDESILSVADAHKAVQRFMASRRTQRGDLA